MAYATVAELQSGMLRQLSQAEESVAAVLLERAARMIDSYQSSASDALKGDVSCRMVERALGDGETNGIPVGATQGSMSALSYTQSWTMGSGSAGELYISKQERQMLGLSNRIGTYSPTEELVRGYTGY